MRAILPVVLLLAACGAKAPRTLRVLAAASLRPALEALAAQWAPGDAAVEIVYGATGQLVAQIEQGARFDVFLGADAEHAARLARAGHAQPAFAFARGRLALWVRRESAFDPARDGLAVVVADGVGKVAVANPRHAPYGAAALEALDRAGLRARVEARLVFAENVAQALHFAASGGADVAMIAASLLEADGGRGRSVLVDAALHAPLVHAGAIAAAADAAAPAFVEFLRGRAGQALLAAHGFAVPE